MSLHTFVIDGRKRLQISQSKTEPGKVLVQVLDSARDVLFTCSMAAATAGVASQALELEAVAAEGLAESVKLAKGLAASVSGCTALREDLEALETLHKYREKYENKYPMPPAKVQAYADTSGAPSMRALPVVDVAQVGA